MARLVPVIHVLFRRLKGADAPRKGGHDGVRLMRCARTPYPRSPGATVGLEKEAEQHCAVGRDRFVLIAGGTPDELAGPAFALVILEGALGIIGLFHRG